MRGLALIQATYLLCSLFILASSAPFENEIRTRKDEMNLDIPPVFPAMRQFKERDFSKREDSDRFDDEKKEARELAENEFPDKTEHESSEKNAEEFFKRLESELARRESRHFNEKENSEEWKQDKELHGREFPEGRGETSEDEEGNARIHAEETGLEHFKREMEKEFGEQMARGMPEEENKRDLGEKEEDMKVFRTEGMYERELLEDNDEIPNRELKTELAEVEDNHKREFSEEDNEKNEEVEGGSFWKSERNLMKELAEHPALNHKTEEEEEIALPGEMTIRRMLEDSGEELPKRNEKFEDNRARGAEALSRRGEEFPKNMREQEAEIERERFDYHGNEERERKEFRERQRERALGNGRKVHEKEMEGRKRRELIGSHGMRREERERFRFRARGE